MNKKVLIIENHIVTANMAAFLLSFRNITTIIAIDGPTGIDMASREKPNLILLDIMMPEMDGFEVCRILKSNASTAEIPVVIMSIKGTNKDIELGFALGCVEYIVKPFHPKKLIETVEKYLNK